LSIADEFTQWFNSAADFQRNGDLVAAESQYSRLLGKWPDNFAVLQEFGFLRFEQGRFLEALSLIGTALKANPNSSIALVNYAVILDALQRREEALAYYDKALAIKPDYAQALFNRGLALRSLKRPAEALASFDMMLAISPDDVDAINNRGKALRDLNRPNEALASFDKALAIKPTHVEALNNRGNALRDLNRTAEAVASYDKALAIRPDYVEALNNRGSALRELKRPAEAVASYDRALAIGPNHAGALYNRGNALRDLNRTAEALASYDKALAIKPDYAEALNNRGSALREMKRTAEALASFDAALRIKPDNADCLSNRGLSLRDLKRPTEALASIDKALAINPSHVKALNNRGNALRDLNRTAEALASYDKALAIKPDDLEARNNRGMALLDLYRPDEALASFDEALRFKPNDSDALNYRGLSLRDLGRPTEALASFDKALAINPDSADTFYNRGVLFQDFSRLAEALESFEKALAIAPDHRYAFGGIADAALASCDWTRTAAVAGELGTRIAQPRLAVHPFTLLGYTRDPSLQCECARQFARYGLPVPAQPLYRGAVPHSDKIRIAYLSSNFRRHALSFLMAELFELHDREKFEVLGISFGPDDHTDIRARLVRAFDQFHDVRLKNDRDVANLLSDLRVNVAIDLNGHTRGSRPGILAHRPAPIQVNYMGYPGTMGADFIDYVIADRIVLPFDQERCWTEKIVHLPDSYWVTDSKMPISPRVFTRDEAGLPNNAFVFCCFNQNYKINPAVFDVWMRLLRSVQGSVLWLLRDNDPAMINLQREAAARDVDPARVVFAEALPLESHLARHRLADLFLDTLHYNAHTTASDALWAGLPLLTCKGATFASRVATSLLHAVGLPELATNGLGEYEALALRLATDESLLRAFRHRFEQNRLTCPLFDTNRFRVHIERAYATMWDMQRRGEPPQSFSVDP
jgi:protein O-GlcNAc transferase